MRKILLIPLEISGILLILVVIGLLGAIFGIYQFNKKPKPVSRIETAYVVTADDLFNEFEQNESKAAQMYIDNVIEVKGEIVEMNSNLEGNTSFILDAENAIIGGINAALGQKEDISPYNVGDQITLKCKCIGYNMEVILNNCLIKHAS